MSSASFEHAISFAAELIRTPGLPGQEAAVRRGRDFASDAKLKIGPALPGKAS